MPGVHQHRDHLQAGGAQRGVPRGVHQGGRGVPRGRGLPHLPDLRPGLDPQPAPVHLLVSQRQDGQLPRGEGRQGDHLLHRQPDHGEQADLQQREQEGRGELHLQPQQQRPRHCAALRHEEK